MIDPGQRNAAKSTANRSTVRIDMDHVKAATPELRRKNAKRAIRR